MEYASACERFIVIPELVDLVRAHLTKRELLRLLVVNRNFNDIFFPAFYGQVDLRNCSTIFLKRIATESLVLSVPHIRRITLDDEFLEIYSKGVVAFKDNPTTTVDSGRRLGDSFHLRNVIPLPPMDQLSGLIYSPSLQRSLETSTQYRRVGMNFMRLCWATELSPLLTRLSAGTLLLSNRHEPGVLARVIGGLLHLRDLELTVRCSAMLWSELLVGITRHCPPVVQEIRLAWTLQEGKYQNTLRLDQLETIDKDEVLLPMPQEPLLHLTKLDLEESFYYRFQDICPLLERCPSLKTLSPPSGAYLEDLARIATCVSQYCPKLRRVYRRLGNRELQGTTTLGAIVGAMPMDSLQHLLLGAHNNSGSDICRGIPRHYESLTTIKFPGGASLDNAVILGILRNCGALEEFEVQGNSEHLWDVSIPLEEAGEELWASNRIRVLELAIDLGEISELTYPKPPEETSGRQLTRIRQLEMFYRRIAVQHRMTNLCLKVAEMPSGPKKKSRHHGHFEFPAMLDLELATGCVRPRQGYLQLFSGLSQLKTLTGSFGHQLCNPSKAELAWLQKHWPKFQHHAFARERTLRVLN